MEFKEFENQTDDSLMSEAEKVKLEVLKITFKSSYQTLEKINIKWILNNIHP